MNKHNALQFFYNLTRCSIGIIFIYSGYVKLMDPMSFATIIDAFGLVPEITNIPAALSIATLEIIGGTGMLFDTGKGLEIVTGLVILFLIILGYGIRMGLDIDCGCFGPEDPESKAFHGLRAALYRDIIILAGIVFLYIWRRIYPERISKMQRFTFFQKRSVKNEYL